MAQFEERIKVARATQRLARSSLAFFAGVTRQAINSIPYLLIPVIGLAQGGARSYTERFRVVDSVILESTIDNPVVRLSGVAILPNGGIVATDLSEAVARVYSSKGRLLGTVGRRGDGPGEFRAPVQPQLDRSGRLHVLDIANLRIQAFELAPDGKTGRHVRTTTLSRTVRAAYGFVILNSGDYVVAGAGGVQDHVAFLVDSLGRMKNSFLPIAKLRPRGVSAESEFLFRSLSIPTLATNGREVFVALPTFDSLWVVQPTTAAVRSIQVPTSGYRQPAAPSPLPHTREGIRSWAYSQVVTAVFASPDYIFFPVFRGAYNEGVSSGLSFRDANGTWHLYSSMPSIVASRGDTLLAMKSIDEPIVLTRLHIGR